MNILRPFPVAIALGVTGLWMLGTPSLGQWSALAQAGLQLNLPDLNAPGNRESGSSRSESCLEPGESLVALMPDSNYALTRNGHPRFFFYLPPTNAEAVNFILYHEESGAVFYEGHFSIEDKSGIVSLSLPDNGLQQSLEADEAYYWYFSVVCASNDPNRNEVVSGTVQRITPDAETAEAIAAANPQTLPAVYAQAGLWQDALAAAAALKQDGNPAAWNALLQSVELQSIAEAPLLSERLPPAPEAASEPE